MINMDQLQVVGKAWLSSTFTVIKDLKTKCMKQNRLEMEAIEEGRRNCTTLKAMNYLQQEVTKFNQKVVLKVNMQIKMECLMDQLEFMILEIS